MEINKDIHAIVTGGGSGLGAATVKRLASYGAKVSIIDLSELQAQVTAEGLNAKVYATDVCDEAAVKHTLQQATDHFGPIQILVNCAGILAAERIVGREGPMALETFSKVIQVNLIGTFNMMRLTAALMSEGPAFGHDQERGIIINTASVAAFEGQIGQAAYSASKGGVAALTLPAAREFARFGIRVNAIAPGLFETPMMTQLSAEAQQSLAEQVPYPSRLGFPKEYAQLVCHMVENPMLNGEVVRLDGAIRLQPK